MACRFAGVSGELQRFRTARLEAFLFVFGAHFRARLTWKDALP